MLENKEIKEITKGLNLPKKYFNNLPKDYRGNLYRTIKVKRKEKNIFLTRFCDYVSIQKIKFEYTKKGIKTTVKVDQNYKGKYQFTEYYNKKGLQINRKEFYKN